MNTGFGIQERFLTIVQIVNRYSYLNANRIQYMPLISINRINSIKSAIALVFFCSILNLNAQDLDIYNQEGNATAYFDLQDEDQTIYFINGKAVAYLYLSDTIYQVYGFNGLHLGWYHNGVLRDKEGFMVGCVDGACYVIPRMGNFVRPFKQLKPFKSFRDLPSFQPQFIDLFSKLSLHEFLLNGIR